MLIRLSLALSPMSVLLSTAGVGVVAFRTSLGAVASHSAGAAACSLAGAVASRGAGGAVASHSAAGARYASERDKGGDKSIHGQWVQCGLDSSTRAG